MWIRSQDKRLIKECREITINGTSIVNYHGLNFVVLGEYSTEEKTLMVLDEINERINAIEFIKVFGKDFFEETNKDNHIIVAPSYDMPLDEEVEIS